MNELEQRSANLLQLLGMCANLAPGFRDQKPGPWAKSVLDQLRDSIEALWEQLAVEAIVDFPGAAVNTAHPGYIIMDKVLIPFFLLQDLPGTRELAELTSIGLSLRLTDDGVICLSGSTALLGTLKYVGDIDYCEYALPATFTTAKIVASVNSHAVRTTLPLCERIKVMNTKWTRNCSEWDSSASDQLLHQIDLDGAYHLKLDFVTNSAAVGTAEATNVVLLLVAGKEDEILRASFAAQEVPIPGSVLPRPLCDPLQLGRYINFLLDEVLSYALDNPVKGLKRALSLERILMLREWDDDLETYLQDPRAALTSAVNARATLLTTLSAVTDHSASRAETLKQLRRTLEGTIAGLQNQLPKYSETAPSTKAAMEHWGAEVAVALTTFLQDAKQAIAAAETT